MPQGPARARTYRRDSARLRRLRSARHASDRVSRLSQEPRWGLASPCRPDLKDLVTQLPAGLKPCQGSHLGRIVAPRVLQGLLKDYGAYRTHKTHRRIAGAEPHRINTFFFKGFQYETGVRHSFLSLLRRLLNVSSVVLQETN